jgi:hypothetical protein
LTKDYCITLLKHHLLSRQLFWGPSHRNIARVPCYLRLVCLTDCPYATATKPLTGFYLNLTLGSFTKIYLYIPIRLNMRAITDNLRQYLDLQVFLSYFIIKYLFITCVEFFYIYLFICVCVTR